AGTCTRWLRSWRRTARSPDRDRKIIAATGRPNRVVHLRTRGQCLVRRPQQQPHGPSRASLRRLAEPAGRTRRAELMVISMNLFIEMTGGGSAWPEVFDIAG